MNTMKQALKNIVLPMAAVLALVLLAGCAGSNFGKITRNRDLNNMFLDYQVLPEHRYYITGGYAAPNAIIAIHRDFELVNGGNLWVGVPNVDSGQIRRWVDTIAPEQNFRAAGGAYFASYILDPGGRRIGAWYSYESYATIKFFEDNRVEVYPPDLNQGFTINKARKGRF